MAASDFIVVSSSPPRYPRLDVAGMSSSPGLPSPRALVRPKAPLRASIKVSPIMELTNAVSSKNRTNLLWEIPDDRPRNATGMAGETILDKPAKGTVPRTPRARKSINGQKDPVVKKPRKVKAKKSDVIVVDGDAPKDKAPRRPRTKKEVVDSQTKIPRGRVTKISTISCADKSNAKKKTGVVSSHFASATGPSAGPISDHEESSNDILLQEAVKRRFNWTPPKATICQSDLAIASDRDALENRMMSTSDRMELNITKQWNFMGKFGYSNEDEKGITATRNESVVTRKRKLIELVETNAPPIASPEKPKAVTKKVRTITELATSAYATNADEVIENLSPAPLLQYFSCEGQLGTRSGSKGKSKSRSKSPAKSSKVSKSKKGTIEAPILLSPETALRRSARQEFVFGTSSQLAREESPTLLRDLQRAMQASNKIDDDVSANFEDWKSLQSNSTTGQGTDLYKAKRNLWGAASHGVEGEDVLTLDLSRSPEVSKSARPHGALSCPPGTVTIHALAVERDEWHELGEDNVTTEKKNNVEAVVSQVAEPVKSRTRVELLRSLTRTNPKIPVASTIGPIPSLEPSTLLKESEKELPILQKPEYRSYPTAQLAKEIASYRFKTIKSRDQMIALLERCWECKHRVALGNLGTNTNLVAQAAYSNKSNEKVTEAVKAPRGRPRKDSLLQNAPGQSKVRTASPKRAGSSAPTTVEVAKPLALRQTPKKQLRRTIPIEEIDDSDTPFTPSPQRRSPSKIRTPPPPLQLSTSPAANNDESTLLSPTAQQARLHRHITRAIASAPPSTDPKQPSWHEKILLYDPIVLEDLAAWLNMGALQRVGWDGEVAPQEVKAWCLAQSVCCLWRENLRGQARSRY